MLDKCAPVPPGSAVSKECYRDLNGAFPFGAAVAGRAQQE